MKSNPLAVAVLTSIIPVTASSFGLGHMTVSSGLDQPFRAEIPLYHLKRLPLSSINVAVATEDAYRSIQLQHDDILADLQFDIKKNRLGVPTIYVSTLQRISDPYFELLLRIITPDTEFYKQYSILLDPADYPHDENDHKITGKRIALTVPQTPVSTIPAIAFKPKASSMFKIVETSLRVREKTYGPTLPEDSVWDIAAQFTTPDLSVDQAVLAIVGTNSKAFTQGNLNGLKTGEKLLIPQLDEIKRVPTELAQREVLAHDTAWKYKQEIQHVILPPYLDGMRGITQFDLPKRKHYANARPATAPNPIPHNMLASNTHNIQNPGTSTQDINPEYLAHNIAFAQAYQATRSSDADMRALRAENEKLEQEVHNLSETIHEIRSQLATLMQYQSSGLSAQTIDARHSLYQRITDYIIALLSFISGALVAHFSARKRKVGTTASPAHQKFTQDDIPAQTAPISSPAHHVAPRASASENPIIQSAVPAPAPAEQDAAQHSDAPHTAAKSHEPLINLASKASDAGDNTAVSPADTAASSQTRTNTMLHEQEDSAPLISFEAQADNTLLSPEHSSSEDSHIVTFPFADTAPQHAQSQIIASESQTSKQAPVTTVPADTRSTTTLSPHHHASDLPTAPTLSPGSVSVIDAPLINFDIHSRNTETTAPPFTVHKETIHPQPTPLTTSNAAFNSLLDLADKYISMEDTEAAQLALQEVIQYGSADQKIRAQNMLDKII